jgi:hypothetical protein
MSEHVGTVGTRVEIIEEIACHRRVRTVGTPAAEGPASGALPPGDEPRHKPERLSEPARGLSLPLRLVPLLIWVLRSIIATERDWAGGYGGRRRFGGESPT